MKIGLALQGGGSHGAFTWGVLHELLDCRELDIEVASGTSAGAINAVIMADGWVGTPEDRRGGAQDALERFWNLNSLASGSFTGGVMRPMPWDSARGDPTLKNNPFFLALDLTTRLFTQHELGGGFNPLGELLEHWYGLDTGRLRDPAAPLLFLSATDVATGDALIFDNGEIGIAAILASACLPTLTRAVDVRGRPCWDGGYSANPALWPVIQHSDVEDVLIIQVNPVEIDTPPANTRDVINRINELTFNSSLVAQSRATERQNDLYLVVDELCAGLDELEEQQRSAILQRVARRMAEHDAARERALRVRGRAHRWRLPRRLVDALCRIPDQQHLDTRQFEELPLRPIALHMVHGDHELARFDASSKYNATPEFLTRLFELGRSRAREWIERTLPTVLQNRELGLSISTFASERGLSSHTAP